MKKKKIEHGTEVVEWVPGKFKGTLDSLLHTMRPPTRSQHTNFRGVRRKVFNVVVFVETATRANCHFPRLHGYLLRTEQCRG